MAKNIPVHVERTEECFSCAGTGRVTRYAAVVQGPTLVAFSRLDVRQWMENARRVCAKPTATAADCVILSEAKRAFNIAVWTRRAVEEQGSFFVGAFFSWLMPEPAVIPIPRQIANLHAGTAHIEAVSGWRWMWRDVATQAFSPPTPAPKPPDPPVSRPAGRPSREPGRQLHDKRRHQGAGSADLHHRH